MHMWPEGKWTELSTRLILGCSGSAFQKLQLNAEKITKNEKASIQALIEILGGQWGQIPLERKYEYAERALFRSSQRSDETNDSYLARCDVAWSELLTRKVTLEELQAYIVLRGSTLGSDDKKRVIIESENKKDGKLTIERVSSAIRMLGAGFFQEMVTGKRSGKLKTYDASTLLAEDAIEDETALNTETLGDAPGEDEMMETLVQEGDDDALLIADFEAAAMDLVQSDEELASIYTAYTDARRRLSDKMKSRGFWPIKGKTKGRSKGSKGKFQKGHPSSRRSLQSRILDSTCRICHQVGHWKAECPNRPDAGQNSNVNRPPQAPTSYVQAAQDSRVDAAMPLEFLNLPDTMTTLDVTQPEANCYMHTVDTHTVDVSRNRLMSTFKRIQNKTMMRNDTATRNHDHSSALRRRLQCRLKAQDAICIDSNTAETAIACFATHGSLGVVDLGATKTVIGSNQVKDLLASLDDNIRQKVTKSPCRITFRFGNQGTLQSEFALVVPIHGLLLKIAVVPGSIPFLLSNTLLRALGAVIDTEDHLLLSKKFRFTVPLQLTGKGLFLMDLNALAQTSAKTDNSPRVEETHMTIDQDQSEKSRKAAEGSNAKVSSDLSDSVLHVSAPEPKNHVQGQAQDTLQISGMSETLRSKHVSEISQIPSSQHVARLQRMQSAPVDSASKLDLEAYTLDQLETMKIAFGKQQIGKTFATVWKHEQRWVTWFLQHYQESKKPEHMLLIRYVELKVERAKMEDQTIPLTSAENPPKISYAQNSPQSYAMPKTKAAAKARPTPDPWVNAETESHFEFLTELEDVVTQENPALTDPHVINLEQRIYQMENALFRVINFIENQSTPTPQ